jgi:hypothetical protein
VDLRQVTEFLVQLAILNHWVKAPPALWL